MEANATDTIEIVTVETANGTVEHHAAGCKASTRKARSTRTSTVARSAFLAEALEVEAEREALNVPYAEAETKYHRCITRGAK